MMIDVIKSRYVNFLLALSAGLALSACGDNNSVPPVAAEPESITYEITVTNLTHAQPMSPVAVILSSDGQLWQIGEPATIPLEKLAEGGESSELFSDSLVLNYASGAGVLLPGMSETLSVNLEAGIEAKLSVVSMLVNTNDAFTGLDSYDLGSLEEGQSVMFYSMTFDAGTERNSEMAGTIPGPADGGLGFESARDDVNFVAVHPGVLTEDDGLVGSVLTSQHKFDNPTAQIQITRLQQ